MKLYWLNALVNSHFVEVGSEVKPIPKQYIPQGENSVVIITKIDGDVIKVKFDFSDVEFELYLTELRIHAPRKGSLTKKGRESRLQKMIADIWKINNKNSLERKVQTKKNKQLVENSSIL